MRFPLTLLFIFALGFLASCGQSSPTSSVLVRSSFALTASEIDMVIVGKNHGTNMGFSRMFSGDLQLELENGDWEFNVFSWEKSASFGAYTGVNRCGSVRKVLTGGVSTVTINVAGTLCGSLGDPAYVSGGNFLILNPVSCDSLVGVTNFSSSCTPGPALSYSVAFVPYEYSPLGTPNYVFLGLTKSMCSSSALLRLPVLTTLGVPFILRAHSSASCADSAWDQSYFFKQGLATTARSKVFQNGVNTKLFLLDPLNAAPTVANYAETDQNEDSTFTFILPYTDPESDQASACALTSLVNVSISTACTCTSGVCSVGLTGAVDYFGAATFDYKVMASGSWSNWATVGFNLLPVNDNPDLGTISPIVASAPSPYPASFIPTDVDGDSLTCATATVSSSNTSVLPLGNISAVTGSGTCSFTVTPSASGSSTVTVVLPDGNGGSGVTSFVLSTTY